MTDQEGHPAGWEGYRDIGLIANPYLTSAGHESEGPGVGAAVRSAALKALVAIEEALHSERPKPVRILKTSDLPSYYPRSAMSVVLRELGAQTKTGLLTCYVPLIMMRKGRIRGTLSVVAEMVVGRGIDTTIARYASTALRDPDTTLPEWEAVAALDVTALIERFETAPQATVEEVFGAPDELREEGADDSLQGVMREAGMRQVHQTADPQEGDDTPEESALDELVAEVESETSSADDKNEISGDEEEPEPEPEPESALVVRYVIAHMRVHASKVLARALRAYVASGTAAMTQELKITRAPRKTLGALAKLAGLTYRSVVVLYDGFEGWEEIPDDLRLTIVSGLSEVRYALGAHGTIVIAGSDKEQPEIDDQFANAIRVSWDMSELPQVESPEAPLDMTILEGWFHSATLPGADASKTWKLVADSVGSAKDLVSGVALASATVEDAAESVTSTN